MRAFLLGLIAFTALSTSLSAQSPMPHHPLDGLTTPEYWTIHDVLEQSGRLTDKTLFSSLLLHEPAKDKVLAWKAGDPIPREADAAAGNKALGIPPGGSGRRLAGDAYAWA